MAEENIGRKFRLKHIDKTRNYLTEEIKQDNFISKNHEKVCTVVNHIEQSLILISAVTGCVSVSGFVL